MPLIVLRHTRPIGAEGVCYGRTDLGLAEDFERHAAEIEARLPHVDRILTSPLTRCRLLAGVIGARRNLSITVEEDLVEMDFGQWEGVPWDQVPRAELDAWADDFLEAKPHGGESVRDLEARTTRALARARALTGSVLCVAHAGIIKASLVLHGDAKGWHAETQFGEWRVFE